MAGRCDRVEMQTMTGVRQIDWTACYKIAGLAMCTLACAGQAGTC